MFDKIQKFYESLPWVRKNREELKKVKFLLRYFFEGPRRPCTLCKGTGFVTEDNNGELHMWNQFTITVSTTICPWCMGTGVEPNSDKNDNENLPDGC